MRAIFRWESDSGIGNRDNSFIMIEVVKHMSSKNHSPFCEVKSTRQSMAPVKSNDILYHCGGGGFFCSCKEAQIVKTFRLINKISSSWFKIIVNEGVPNSLEFTRNYFPKISGQNHNYIEGWTYIK